MIETHALKIQGIMEKLKTQAFADGNASPQMDTDFYDGTNMARGLVATVRRARLSTEERQTFHITTERKNAAALEKRRAAAEKKKDAANKAAKGKGTKHKSKKGSGRGSNAPAASKRGKGKGKGAIIKATSTSIPSSSSSSSASPLALENGQLAIEPGPVMVRH